MICGRLMMLPFTILLLSSTAYTEVYSCVDEKGGKYFSDRGCPTGPGNTKKDDISSVKYSHPSLQKFQPATSVGGTGPSFKSEIDKARKVSEDIQKRSTK